MEVHVEATGALTRRLHVKLPAAELQAEVEARLKRMASRARIPGFRPGKAPLKVIRQQYGESLRLDAISELVRRSYPQALEQAKIQPAGTPHIEIESETPDAPLAYTASFDVFPEINLETLGKLVIERPVVEVTDVDVDRLIANLRRARREWETVARPAQDGDRCSVDFEGRIDGEAFPGNRGEKVQVELGGGQFLRELEASLVGHAAGDRFTAEVRFSDDYRREDLRGKTASFELTLHEVQEPRLPEIDEAFLQAHGVAAEAGIQGLREKCRAALESERDRAVRARLRQQVLEQLLARHPLEVPPSQVEGEVARLREEAAARMNLGKMKPERKAQLLPSELFESRARQRVALGLLIAEVIRVRGIELDAAKVQTALDEIAADYENPEQVRDYYRAHPELMRGLSSRVLEDQVIDTLLADAELRERSMSLDELLQNAAQGG